MMPSLRGGGNGLSICLYDRQLCRSGTYRLETILRGLCRRPCCSAARRRFPMYRAAVKKSAETRSTEFTHLTASHLGNEDVVDGWSRRVGGKHVGLTASRAVLQIRRQDCRFRRTAYRQ